MLSNQNAFSKSALPRNKGVGLVKANCISCHSEKIIIQNRMTRKNWDQTITWMQEKQNLWPLDPKVRKEILDYLTRNFSPNAKDSIDLGLGPRQVNPLPHKIR